MSPFLYNHEESPADVASRLQAVIQTAVDGIITIDEFGTIDFVNPSTCNIFGFEPEEMIGNNITMLMPTPDKERHDDYIHAYKDSGIKRIIGIGREVKGQKKDGSIFPFWLSVSEVKLENKRLFTGIVHDLTEQKRVEEDLLRFNSELEGKIAERTEKLSDTVDKLLATNQRLHHEIQERKAIEQALIMSREELQKIESELREALKKERELGELKTRFVSMASHEFRTPLSTILSSASLMAQYTLTEQQDKREKHFNKIKSAVTTLTGILNDFLSLARLEEGRVEVNIESFEFNTFCSEVIDEMQSILKPHQVIIANHFDESVPVKLDKKLLKLILINLISNAAKYSDDGTEIICNTELVKNKFTISVKDHGIGIPDEDKHHMFDRFFRASNAMNIKGTGLGLNIVKRYVEMLNGTISFESEFGKGSIFTIVFNLKG